MQKQIDEVRLSITNDKGKYKNKDLVTKRKELEKINEEAQTLLKEVVDEDKLKEIMGPENARTFMAGGCQAINIISMGSLFNTSNGLSVIEHNHQVIDNDGLHSETDRGTNNFKDWKLIIHDYRNCMEAILTKLKNIRRDKQRYDLVDLLGWKR